MPKCSYYNLAVGPLATKMIGFLLISTVSLYGQTIKCNLHPSSTVTVYFIPTLILDFLRILLFYYNYIIFELCKTYIDIFCEQQHWLLFMHFYLQLQKLQLYNRPLRSYLFLTCWNYKPRPYEIIYTNKL